MSSEFQTLYDKIAQLADLTQQLRRENAELRLRAAALQSENTDMTQRMHVAKNKVAALMEKYPVPAVEEKEAS